MTEADRPDGSPIVPTSSTAVQILEGELYPTLEEDILEAEWRQNRPPGPTPGEQRDPSRPGPPGP